MSDTLFDLETPRPKKREPDIQPRLGKVPRYARCSTCHATILEALPEMSGVVEADPYTLTPAAVQAATILGRNVYRCQIGPKWWPGEPWLTHPTDLNYFTHWEWYWLPNHKCHAPPLDGYPLQIKPPPPPITECPY